MYVCMMCGDMSWQYPASGKKDIILLGVCQEAYVGTYRINNGWSGPVFVPSGADMAGD